MAEASTGIRVPLASLPLDHLTAAKQAVSNILSTPRAFETYAQVVDGIPTREIFSEFSTGYTPAVVWNNLEPSPAAKELLEGYRSNVEWETLEVNAKVAQAFQDSEPGSHEYKMRLIEMICVLCHDLAATLFERMEGGIRKPDINRPRTPPKLASGIEHLLPEVPPEPTLLYHGSCLNCEEYPRGVADAVGYWTDYRLLGGVVLFDRGESGKECNNIFIHPVRRYRIFQLSMDQVDRLIEFFKCDDLATLTIPLPLKPEKGTRRISSYESMSEHIYRDRYERKIPSTPPRTCVVRLDDEDEYQEMMAQMNRWRETRSEWGVGAASGRPG